MKLVRRILIVLLVIAIGALYYYKQNNTSEASQDIDDTTATSQDIDSTETSQDIIQEEAPQEIPASNVTIVEAREQTEAEEHPDFAVEEFVLVLPEGTNVALGKKVECSSYTQVYNAPKAVDGHADGASYWEGKPEYPNTLTVDLENPTKIHAIRLALNPLPIWSKRNQTIAVNISSDGENFTELVASNQYTFDPELGNEVQISFEETEAKFVQLVITENTGAGGGQIAEFEVYSK